MTCPMNPIFSFIFGSRRSMDLRLFICFTKSETLPVDILSARIDSPRYFSSSSVLRFIYGGKLRYILASSSPGVGSRSCLRAWALTRRACISTRKGSSRANCSFCQARCSKTYCTESLGSDSCSSENNPTLTCWFYQCITKNCYTNPNTYPVTSPNDDYSSPFSSALAPSLVDTSTH